MRTMVSSALASSICLLAVPTAQALTFTEAFDAALRTDAQFRAAEFDLQSSRQGVPIARAALLPNVSLSVGASNVNGTRQYANAVNQDVRLKVDYAAPNASLAMRMPLINLEAQNRYRQSQVQTDQAESVFRTRGLDLINRLAAAYLQVLLAEEGRQLVEVQLQSQTTQLKQAEQRLSGGEGTRVDVASSRANLDIVRARLVEAEDQLQLSHLQLKRITGIQTTALRRLPSDLTPMPLQPEGLFGWLDLAMRQSPSVRAREQAVDVARLTVKRNQAQHMPRLDLVASMSRSENESLSSLNQTATLRSVGLQLNVPIYSGGGIDAAVKQAMADLARVEEELRSEKENVAVEVQRNHQAVTNGIAKIAAQQRAVESTALAVTATGRGLQAGVSTLNDVADAQARHFTARRDLVQLRIDQLLARTRLLISAGVLMPEIVADFDSALASADATPTTKTP
jgi:protease secretion system outer membrane protein